MCDVLLKEDFIKKTFENPKYNVFFFFFSFVKSRWVVE